MFIRIKGSPTTKKKYVQICKSFREGSKVRQKVVGSLGAVDDLLEAGEIEKIAESLMALTGKSFSKGVKELKRYQWGAVKVIEKLWKIFELDSFLKKQLIGAEFDFKSIVQLLTIDRFMNPRSKLKTYENASRYLGVEDPDLQHIYRSLEILSSLKPNLEKHLFDINRKNFGMNVDIVFFDATTLYFHSDKEDELRKFGFSKDCKFNDVQVVMGLLMDEEGRPIGFQSFPGNTFDGKTLLKALSELKETFQIQKLIIVEEEVKYLDESKIFSDSQWDGFYGILTNVEKDLKSDEEIYDAYHQLWKIEECFRTLKSHLKIRPVYLRKPERIQGHLVLCFLTFAFERHLEIELKKQSKWTTPDRLRAAISDLQASLVEINQKQYLLRSEIDPHAKTILELLKIPTPQDLTLLSEF